MSWSLDWFAAEALAKSGAQIRRVGWTDRVLVKRGALWMLVSGATTRIVKATDFTAGELNARDWTDQPFNANPCAAAPAFNSQPIVYGNWSDGKINFDAPPPPGFPDLNA
jgi:hypothetical protein